ncbi:CoA transferase [Rhodopila sp.]|uniref:CoA transferase n=1 Tax=Rhodopila sp. TaxID=2480087 RepID=UPI002B5EC028|nr:CoA transferase [Rhodopila sp.]HVZ08096.1 CoA transferase [Rhodopila sp.]
MSDAGFSTVLRAIWTAAGGAPEALAHAAQRGSGGLPSVFAVSDLAAGSVAAAGLAAAELVAARRDAWPAVTVDRRLASVWFGMTLRPEGWRLPPAWDPIAGDYAASDGWIRLHTNAPHHRAAALAVLGVPEERAAVAQAVARWSKSGLEAAVVARSGCAAAMLTLDEWAGHPQGRAVAAEPLVHHDVTDTAAEPAWTIPRDRPLAGLRVLDLTRVLAGPVATRFLAGLGAEVLRIDPPGWEEPGVVPEVVLGKRTARLDLRDPAARATLETLLAGADVMVHGYRPDALERMGLGADRRRAVRPGLVDVCLDAYGWTGPWRARRGFDSLVQMSSGIADAGMRRLGKDKPFPLPVQALDHACGYAMATAALRGITGRLRTGQGSASRLSLARIAALLTGLDAAEETPLAPETPDDLSEAVEATGWGPARRIKPPVEIEGTRLAWAVPSGPLGAGPPAWVG